MPIFGGKNLQTFAVFDGVLSAPLNGKLSALLGLYGMHRAALAFNEYAGVVSPHFEREARFKRQIAVLIEEIPLIQFEMVCHRRGLARRDIDEAGIGAAFETAPALELIEMLQITHLSLPATRELTAFPSARPLVSSMTSFMTLPISALAVSPDEAITFSTILPSSSALSCFGK